MLENMTMRGLSSRSVLLLCLFVLLALLGLYSHNNTTKLLNKNRIDFVKLSEQKDAIDAELQVAVEQHKDCTNQLQKLTVDLKSNRKELDELRITNSKLEHEVTSKTQECAVEVKDLQSQLKKAQDDYDTLQQKIQQDRGEQEAEYRKLEESLKKTQQEKDSEVQTLKDRIADLNRTNVELNNVLQRLNAAPKSKNPIESHDVAQRQVENPIVKKLPIDSSLLYLNKNVSTPAAEDVKQKDLKKENTNSDEQKPIGQDSIKNDSKNENADKQKPMVDGEKNANSLDQKSIDEDQHHRLLVIPPPPAEQPIKAEKKESAAAAEVGTNV